MCEHGLARNVHRLGHVDPVWQFVLLRHVPTGGSIMVAPNSKVPEDRMEESLRDPSPEEIRVRAAKIRRRWDSQTRERRSVHSESKAWLPPGVNMADVFANAFQPDSN